MQLRRMYKNDPSMQWQFTVIISPESIQTQNSVGAFSKTGWNIYVYWREGKDVIVLVFRSGTYYLLGSAGLSEARRGELRGILVEALPKK